MGIWCWYVSTAEARARVRLSQNFPVQYNWPSQVTAGLVISREGQLQIRTQLQLPAASRTHTLLYLYFSFCIDLKNYFCNISGVRVIEKMNWGPISKIYIRKY